MLKNRNEKMTVGDQKHRASSRNWLWKHRNLGRLSHTCASIWQKVNLTKLQPYPVSFCLQSVFKF